MIAICFGSPLYHFCQRSDPERTSGTDRAWGRRQRAHDPLSGSSILLCAS
jgi:hypothetical protein